MSGYWVAAAICIAVAVVLVNRWRTRRLVRQIGAMLDAAIDGTFSEDHYDESLLSALENKLVQYLSTSAISASSVSAERDQIKTLISDISHQTKTPLANLLLYTQLLSEQELSPRGRVAVDALQAQADKLHFLIDALVKMSRLETGIIAVHPRLQDTQPLMRAVTAQIAPHAAQKNITVTLQESDCTACFDPKWTAEALYNLLDNAVKYTPVGGAVQLSATAFELYCRLDVRDNGIGIAEAEQAHIFGRFYRAQTGSDAEGVGVGLYLARQIAAAQDGYIRVQSAPGQGALFSLYLPRSQRAAPQNSPPSLLRA